MSPAAAVRRHRRGLPQDSQALTAQRASVKREHVLAAHPVSGPTSECVWAAVSALRGKAVGFFHLSGAKAASALAAPPHLPQAVGSRLLNEEIVCPVWLWGMDSRAGSSQPCFGRALLGSCTQEVLTGEETDQDVMAGLLDLSHFSITAAVQPWVNDLTPLSINYKCDFNSYFLWGNLCEWNHMCEECLGKLVV